MAALDLWLRCSVNFHIPSDEKPVERLSGITAGSRARIEMKGFVNSADGFMAIKSPLTLTKAILESLEQKMVAYSKELYDIQYEAVSKRK